MNFIQDEAVVCDELERTPALRSWVLHLSSQVKPRKRVFKTQFQKFLELIKSKEDPVRLLKRLEALGLGKYQIKRKGEDSYFDWLVEPHEVARLIKEDSINSGESPGSGADTSVPNYGMDRIVLDVESKTIEHQFVLRKDQVIKISLPDDITLSECERLSNWIRTLSFAS